MGWENPRESHGRRRRTCRTRSARSGGSPAVAYPTAYRFVRVVTIPVPPLGAASPVEEGNRRLETKGEKETVLLPHERSRVRLGAGGQRGSAVLHALPHFLHRVRTFRHRVFELNRAGNVPLVLLHH